MRIVGVTSSAQVSAHIVPHGIDPRLLLWRDGWVIVQLLTAELDETDITVTALVRSISDHDSPPVARKRRVDAGLIIAAPFPKKQRLAAYGIVTSSSGLLGTQCSDRTNVPGMWQLPGGGINVNETPDDALIREVREETSQQVEIDQLVDLQSDHWLGRAPDGTIEDFHALRLFYRARCLHPTTPRVLDVGGTTARCRWVDRRDWQQLPWTDGVRAILTQHVGEFT